jgi:ring-1,2-phenylacetyl-CoA epoxidase subunit PaaA
MKTERNDSLRQRFVNRFAPAALDLGLQIHVVTKDDDGMVVDRQPDPELRFDEESGNWQVTEPDWDEFYRVIRGHGPCNRKRLALRRLSYEQGRWVRSAILHGRATVPPAA